MGNFEFLYITKKRTNVPKVNRRGCSLGSPYTYTRTNVSGETLRNQQLLTQVSNYAPAKLMERLDVVDELKGGRSWGCYSVLKQGHTHTVNDSLKMALKKFSM